MRIGLIGRAGAGKSTAARYMVRHFGFSVIGFADPIREAAQILGWDGFKDSGGRRLLQDLGDCARAYDQHCFLKRFEHALSAFTDKANIVCDDVRLQPEVEFLRQRGFMIVRVGGRRAELGPASLHITEAIECCDFDHELVNAGSVEDFERALTVLVRGGERA